MSPRKPLGEISDNAQPRKTRRELSPATRGFIIGAISGGMTVKEVAAMKSLNQSTVRKTYKLRNQRPGQKSLPRSGRPDKLSVRDERRLLRHARTNPTATFKEVVDELKLDVSNKVYLKTLKRNDIKHERAAQRPNSIAIDAE